MTVGVGASTRLLALLGDPVGHSLSPVIQNAACRAAGVDGVYVALRCGEEDMPHLLRGLSEAGGGGNVTLPHKERAAAVVNAPSDAVRRTGACNTFWAAEGKIHGDNTDVEGFRRALVRFLGRPPRGGRVLLLGAGGAARAVLVGLLDEDAREVVILNRSTERARAVARRIGDERVRVADDPTDVDGGSFDLVVNATRLGLDPEDPSPLELSRLDRVGAVLDLLYGARKTPFVRAAESHGVRATDGAEMLVQQGAVAFERWWGVEAPVDAMREAMEEGRPGVIGGRTAGGWGRRLYDGIREVGAVLLPGRCLGCSSWMPPDAPDRLVCARCRGRLVDPPWPRCPRCHMPLGTGRDPEPDCLACRAWPAALRSARWAVSLTSPADALVHGLKYEGWRDLALPMAERMARLDPGLPPGGRAPVVVAVPTTRARQRSRGYNQARLLARGVARIRGLELVDALTRRGGGRTQVSLRPDERRLNVEGAFGPVPGAPVAGRPVLLIDDVLTTGSTASAAAVALERAGASGVVVVTFARSVPEGPAAQDPGSDAGVEP